MKYLTIINQELTDGTDASVMHAHDTREEAESEYFSELASGILSPTLKSVFAMVVSTDGNVLRIETVDGLAPAETTPASPDTSGKTSSGQ
jgi:hypothetical protein